MGETVAENRKYLVTDLEQLRTIVNRFLSPLISSQKWEFGLGEIDSPSLKLTKEDPLPSEIMQMKHNWRIQILSAKSKERIGNYVVNAYTGEIY